MLGFLVMLLVAAIVGFIGDAIAPGSIPGGWVGAIVAGLIGSAVGGYLFGLLNLPAGPEVGGLAIIPSIIGAALVVWVYSMITSRSASGRGY